MQCRGGGGGGAKTRGTASGVAVDTAMEKTAHHKAMADLLPPPEPPGPGATAKELMAHRLKTALQAEEARTERAKVREADGMNMVTAATHLPRVTEGG